MDDQTQVEEPGKVIYWLLAVFVIVVMVGLAVFYYVSGTDKADTNVDATQSEVATTTEDDATIDSSINELDQDLKAIDDEINSTEDDTTDI